MINVSGIVRRVQLQFANAKRERVRARVEQHRILEEFQRELGLAVDDVIQEGVEQKSPEFWPAVKALMTARARQHGYQLNNDPLNQFRDEEGFPRVRGGF